MFILDNSIPDIQYMAGVNGVERVFEFEHPLTGTRIVDRFKSNYDFVNQLEHDSITIEEYDDSGNLLRHATSQGTMAYFFPRELRLLLESSGFAIFHEQGSLLEDSPIGPESTEMVSLPQSFLIHKTDRLANFGSHRGHEPPVLPDRMRICMASGRLTLTHFHLTDPLAHASCQRTVILSSQSTLTWTVKMSPSLV